MSLAPPPRMRRRTDGDRRYEPAIEAAIARWQGFAGGERAPEAWWDALRKSILFSPFWIERLRAHGISPRAIESERDLRALPILERAEVARESARMLAIDPAGAEPLVIVKSSGSTGTPVDVVRSDLECLLGWGTARFWAARYGVSLPSRPRAVLFCTLPGGIEYSRRAPLFLRGAIHRISTARPDPVRKLRRIAPALVHTDPDGLRFMLEHEAPPPPLVLSSAQALPPSLRAELRAPLVDYYATTETGPIAWSCPVSPERFHVLGPDVIVESIEGAIVVTRLRPSPWLLLRYATGDRGRVVPGECSCGFRGPSIVELEGRGHVRFVRADGSAVDPWRIAFVFKHRPVRDFRLTQIASERFALEIVGRDETIAERTRAALEALGFCNPQVAVSSHESIEHGPKPAPFRSRS